MYNKKLSKRAPSQLVVSSLLATTAVFSQHAMSDTIAEALSSGTAYGDFRLRFEAVEDDSAKKDADVLMLRSLLGYKTGDVSGFSALVEFEDSRTVASVADYNNTNGSGAEYSVIADPETTELDQAYIQYKAGGLTSKLGRQVLTYDNHRFIGHVGWRQDRQTFDGMSFKYATEGVSVDYAYLEQRNRIFGEEKDIDSSDHLLNLSYQTPIGKMTAYSYLLEQDDNTELAFDTYGLRISGTQKSGDMALLYNAEYATQEKSKQGASDKDADYYLIEGGAVIAGITGKLGYEVLGSDDGSYGFSTPLATLHKFNGWADQFLATPDQGLVDMYASVSGNALGGKWTVAYHDYSADDDTNTIDDLGDEINLVYAKKFGKHYNAGIKYASYSAKDIASVGGNAKSYTDTDKLWLWVGAKF